eukprot:scaffold1231_cov187-Pinguiococcus_pyrenoidosus.AAC.21
MLHTRCVTRSPLSGPTCTAPAHSIAMTIRAFHRASYRRKPIFSTRIILDASQASQDALQVPAMHTSEPCEGYPQSFQNLQPFWSQDSPEPPWRIDLGRFYIGTIRCGVGHEPRVCHILQPGQVRILHRRDATRGAPCFSRVASTSSPPTYCNGMRERSIAHIAFVLAYASSICHERPDALSLVLVELGIDLDTKASQSVGPVDAVSKTSIKATMSICLDSNSRIRRPQDYRIGRCVRGKSSRTSRHVQSDLRRPILMLRHPNLVHNAIQQPRQSDDLWPRADGQHGAMLRMHVLLGVVDRVFVDPFFAHFAPGSSVGELADHQVGQGQRQLLRMQIGRKSKLRPSVAPCRHHQMRHVGMHRAAPLRSQRLHHWPQQALLVALEHLGRHADPQASQRRRRRVKRLRLQSPELR